MTQEQKTEAVLRELDGRSVARLESYAMDLARKLDAVLAECDAWHNPTADAIRAIIEAS